jgi:hypothetical protein
VVVLCDGASDPFGATALYRAAPVDTAPEVTGSLPSAVPPAPRGLMAGNPQDCQPGQYWSFNLAESGSVMLAC